MRFMILIFAGIISFGATLTVASTDANAVVCARGVYRAGCAGYRGAVVVRRPPMAGAVVVRRPVAVCRMVMVNGIRVRRCR